MIDQEAMRFQAARHKELMAASEARLGVPLAWTVRCAAEMSWLLSGMVPPAELMGENGKVIEEKLEINKTHALKVLDTFVEKILPSICGRLMTAADHQQISDEIKLALDAICESEYRVLLGSGKPSDAA